MRQRILVAEDDEAALDGLRALLASWGYEVETASDGRAALEKVASVAPAAVITDVVMPTMDGLQLLAAVHRDRPSLPVIVLTGHGSLATRNGALQGGAYGYLKKPVDVVELKTLLRNALETGGRQPQV